MILNCLVKIIKHHPRLYVSIAVGAMVTGLSSKFGIKSSLTKAIVGYDFGAIVYIFWALHLIFFSTSQQMRKRALTQDDGKLVVLLLVAAFNFIFFL